MKHILFILCCITIQIVHAQPNFKKAYVITHRGDTLYGEVNLKEWGLNPKTIQFKNASNLVVKYNESDLKEFNITNEGHYILYAGRISMGPSQIRDLTSSIDSSYRTDSVFLKIIFHGNKTFLSRYRDGLKERFFISYNDTTSELLSYDYIYRNKSARLMNFPLYKEQLRGIAKRLQLDLDIVEGELEKLKYTYEGLLKFFRAVDNESLIVPVTRSSPSNLFVAINASRQSLSIEGDHRLAGAANTTSYILPGLEIGLNVYTNPRVKKVIFRSAISLDQRKYQMTKEDEVNPGRFMLSDYRYESYDVALKASLVRNLYNSQKLRFYISGGLIFNYSVIRKNDYATQITRSFSEYELNREPSRTTLPLARVWYGVPIESGITYGKVDLFARYTPIVKGLDRGRLNYSIKSDIVGVGLRYNFIKK